MIIDLKTNPHNMNEYQNQRLSNTSSVPKEQENVKNQSHVLLVAAAVAAMAKIS